MWQSIGQYHIAVKGYRVPFAVFYDFGRPVPAIFAIAARNNKTLPLMKKLFHKHVSQRVRRYGRHFTKYLYERDTIFATIWVFVFIVVLGSIPLNLYVLNPIKQALKDFDFNDMAYAKLHKSEKMPIDHHVVIVNIGKANRGELSFLLDKTATYNPKVMGLDVEFHQELDPEQDSLMRASLGRHKNLVLVSRLNFKDENNLQTPGYFGDVNVKRGYGNVITDSDDETRTIRYYSSYEKEKKVRYTSFGAMLVKEYDTAAYEYLMDRKKKQEILNYSRHTNHYQVIDWEQLMADDNSSDSTNTVLDSLLIGKIVLLGYVNTDPNDIEDKFFTPLNEKMVGRSKPDMNGIVVHANYISMVLEKDYIKKLPSWVNWLIAVLIGWLHMSFFIRYYLENHIWFHLVAKIAQVLSAIFFVFVGVAVFNKFNIKLDMKYSLIVIALAVDVIYFYEAFAVWMHKKFHYRTVFHQKHH
jgi:CHASE2 domain-containing sensor protein